MQFVKDSPVDCIEPLVCHIIDIDAGGALVGVSESPPDDVDVGMAGICHGSPGMARGIRRERHLRVHLHCQELELTVIERQLAPVSSELHLG